MGLLSGSASVSRFNVKTTPPALDFEPARFQAIPDGSEVRESAGFVPFEPGAEYEIGARRWAFRVRIDRLVPDPTAVKERLRDLIRGELEGGAYFVSAKRRKLLRELAEEELLIGCAPRVKIIEAVIDGDVLYVGSTSKSDLGIVMQQLRRIGVVIEPKTPWADRGEDFTDIFKADFEHPLVPLREPGASALGCRFLRALIANDADVMIEPEAGAVKVATAAAIVSLRGEVTAELCRHLEQGDEVLSAKLLWENACFTLDGATFRLSGVKIETGRHEHWTDLLDERLEKIAEIFEMLERKYAELRKDLDKPAAPPAKRDEPLRGAWCPTCRIEPGEDQIDRASGILTCRRCGEGLRIKASAALSFPAAGAA